MSHETKFSSAWSEPRFAYIEFAKASTPFLSTEITQYLGPKGLHFNPAHQGVFLNAAQSRNWVLLSGRFAAAHQSVRDLVKKCNSFTVIQDPVDRFAESYREACDNPAHPQHATYKTLSMAEAAALAVAQKADIGRSSQCSGLLASYGGPALDVHNVYEFCQENLTFCGTTDHLSELLDFLKSAGVVAPNLPSLAPAQTPELSGETRRALENVLYPAAADDVHLLRQLRESGPIINPVQAVEEGYKQAQKDARAKCLVYGFSVTGDTPGFVEAWQDRYAEEYPDLRLDKAGIGGLQPHHARHLVRDLLDRWRPNYLIIEISTAIYRLQTKTAAHQQSHQSTIENILALCSERGIKLGILDLPQTDVVPENEWMYPIHEALSQEYAIPRVSVDIRDDILKDNVHPNDAGKALYAEALDTLLKHVMASTVPPFEVDSDMTRFDSYSVADIEASSGVRQMFSRNGFTTEIIRLNQGESVHFKLPKAQKLCGMIVSMGPTTSYLDITLGKMSESVNCFDMHCYYFRVGGRSIMSHYTDTLTITQSSKLPDTSLLKGNMNTGPRLGGVTHFLFESTGQAT
jgi:hypothetical protein